MRQCNIQGNPSWLLRPSGGPPHQACILLAWRGTVYCMCAVPNVPPKRNETRRGDPALTRGHEKRLDQTTRFRRDGTARRDRDNIHIGKCKLGGAPWSTSLNCRNARRKPILVATLPNVDALCSQPITDNRNVPNRNVPYRNNRPNYRHLRFRVHCARKIACKSNSSLHACC